MLATIRLTLSVEFLVTPRLFQKEAKQGGKVTRNSTDSESSNDALVIGSANDWRLHSLHCYSYQF